MFAEKGRENGPDGQKILARLKQTAPGIERGDKEKERCVSCAEEVGDEVFASDGHWSERGRHSLRLDSQRTWPAPPLCSVGSNAALATYCAGRETVAATQSLASAHGRRVRIKWE